MEFELATVVPVLGRPQNVVPLVRSFLESGQPGLLLFVVEVDDVEEMLEVERACENFRVRMLRVVDAHSWPEKINAGVEAVRADWYLCAADDVRFVPGWWDQTRELRNSDVGVIGTNDALPGTPGNPAVANGSHTCHPLISREYIDRYGTIDEPGVAVHDGYRHWCVDNELCVTAMVRGKWAFCREAVILHNHPYWGRGVWDDTYRRGEENNEADLALWEERRTTLLGLP